METERKGEFDLSRGVIKESQLNILYRDALLPLIPIGRIVDIGCNIGTMFGDKAVNVDSASLSELREETDDKNLVIPNFVHADANSLPFKDYSFDYAVLSELLEHVDDPVGVLNEAQRVAFVVVICVPNEYEWFPEHKPFWNPGHKRFFDEESLKKLVGESGLKIAEVIKLSYFGWSYFVLVGLSKNAIEDER